MTINDIQVLGIDSYQSYYFLNPIFLTIKSDSKFITTAKLKFTNRSAISSDGSDLTSAEFKLQSNPRGVIYIDIADYIKSIAVYPNGYRAKTINNNVPYSLNDVSFTIEVSTLEDTESTIFTITKNFIYGYQITQSSNVKCNSLNISDVDNLGKIVGIPYFFDDDIQSRTRYRINESTNTIETYLINKSIIDINNYVPFSNNNCNLLKFRFLNNEGGYDIIYFDNYNYTSNTSVSSDNRIKVNDFTNNRVKFINSSISENKEYTAVASFKERFKGFVDEFINSHYVQIYNDEFSEYQDVQMLSNSLPESFDTSFEISYKFKLINSVNL